MGFDVFDWEYTYQRIFMTSEIRRGGEGSFGRTSVDEFAPLSRWQSPNTRCDLRMEHTSHARNRWKVNERSVEYGRVLR